MERAAKVELKSASVDFAQTELSVSVDHDQQFVWPRSHSEDDQTGVDPDLTLASVRYGDGKSLIFARNGDV